MLLINNVVLIKSVSIRRMPVIRFNGVNNMGEGHSKLYYTVCLVISFHDWIFDMHVMFYPSSNQT